MSDFIIDRADDHLSVTIYPDVDDEVIDLITVVGEYLGLNPVTTVEKGEMIYDNPSPVTVIVFDGKLSGQSATAFEREVESIITERKIING